ncbi:Uncharacterised protein [Vibrio cholerae]|nr:Uncharacterised protein [Vibrio cholerae]
MLQCCWTFSAVSLVLQNTALMLLRKITFKQRCLKVILKQ